MHKKCVTFQPPIYIYIYIYINYIYIYIYIYKRERGWGSDKTNMNILNLLFDCS